MNKDVDINDGEQWENHYKNLLTERNKTNNKLNDEELPYNIDLNKDITLDEVKKILTKLKKKKAVGLDRLSNEIIKNTPIHFIEIILQVFNKCLATGDIPKIWCYGPIRPIYKKGNKLNPNNYKGICVMNAILKVLCLSLNERLKSYLYEMNTINKAQIGFKAKCRTSDHILTLKTLINENVKDKNKKKVFVCFVDFRKAYDSIWQKAYFTN